MMPSSAQRQVLQNAAAIANMAAAAPSSPPMINSRKLADVLFFNVTRLFAILVLAVLGGIIVALFYGAWPAIVKFGVPFLWTRDWNPPADKFGALIPIYGTVVTSLIALLI